MIEDAPGSRAAPSHDKQGMDIAVNRLCVRSTRRDASRNVLAPPPVMAFSSSQRLAVRTFQSRSADLLALYKGSYLLEGEKEPAVRAVLGHFLFVYIHPYMDGNGRLGRFLMNLMLVSAGFVWTVIPVQQRDEYMKALEQAGSFSNIEPFAGFIAALAQAQSKGPLPRPR